MTEKWSGPVAKTIRTIVIQRGRHNAYTVMTYPSTKSRPTHGNDDTSCDEDIRISEKRAQRQRAKKRGGTRSGYLIARKMAVVAGKHHALLYGAFVVLDNLLCDTARHNSANKLAIQPTGGNEAGEKSPEIWCSTEPEIETEVRVTAIVHWTGAAAPVTEAVLSAGDPCNTRQHRQRTSGGWKRHRFVPVPIRTAY